VRGLKSQEQPHLAQQPFQSCPTNPKQGCDALGVAFKADHTHPVVRLEQAQGLSHSRLHQD
jgi:hypothetical protein